MMLWSEVFAFAAVVSEPRATLRAHIKHNINVKTISSKRGTSMAYYYYYYYNDHLYYSDTYGVSIDLLIVRIEIHKT